MSVLISFGHVLFEAGTTIHDQSPWLNQIARKYVGKLLGTISNGIPPNNVTVVNEQ